jgi:hypothetical protein
MRHDYSRACRQGDVILVPVELDVTETPEPIVADDGTTLRGFRHVGEGGAHAHVIERATPVRVGQTDLLRIDDPELLRHIAIRQRADAPHADIALEPGYYEPRIQRVWSPGRRLRFAD